MRGSKITPVLQNRPASILNLRVGGPSTFNTIVVNSTASFDGKVTGSAIPDISPYQGVSGGSILPYGGNNSINGSAKNSSILAGKNNNIAAGIDNGAIIGGTANLLEHDNSFILGAGITSSATNTVFANSMSLHGNISASGHISASGFINVGSTSITLSSSFATTLNFSTNRIMSVTTASALTMSIDADTSILGNVIMTDISSSVGLNLPSSEFKVLNGTFDTTKRNYVYYHYIGNDTALVTINQES